MKIRLSQFPDDEITRKIVRIDGLETPSKRASEKRWNILLKPISRLEQGLSGELTCCTVAPDYLWALQLGSSWKNRQIIENNSLPDAEEFHLDDANPKFLWRDVSQTGMNTFFEHDFLYKNRVSKFPCYQLIWAKDSNNNPIQLCISSTELVRFFIGMSPVLSRHIFGFTRYLNNSDLFRTYGKSFLEGEPESLRILDGKMGRLGRRLMLSILLDPVGRRQIQNFTQSRQAAQQQLSNNEDGAVGIYPVFGLPFSATHKLTVIGSPKDIIIEGINHNTHVPVFGITKIVSTSRKTPRHDIKIVKFKGTGDSGPTRLPNRRKRYYPDENMPHDGPEPADTDAAILLEMGVEVRECYPGLKNIKLEEKIEEHDNVIWVDPTGDPDPDKPIDSTSTISGADHEDGATGLGRGVDDPEKARKQKSLLLVNEELPDLMSCIGNVVLSHSDVVPIDFDQVPARLKLVAALIAKTSSGLPKGWRKGFWDHPGQKEISLIKLDKFPDKISKLENGEERRAIVAILENSEYRVIFTDIERRPREYIGIFTLLMPINRYFGWEQISYILEHRLTPSAKNAAWPSAITHGGGCVAKVHGHPGPFHMEDAALGKKMIKIVSTCLLSQVKFLNAYF